MKLQYIGEADFGYPLYKDENDKLWANTNYNLSDAQGLYSLTGNSADGEPNYSFKSFFPNAEVTFEGEPNPRERAFRSDYMLLSRLESDCKYFLGYGFGNERHLWAGSVEEQILKMKEIWNKFPEDLKPEWLTMEQISEYEKKMIEVKNGNVPSPRVQSFRIEKVTKEVPKSEKDTIKTGVCISDTDSEVIARFTDEREAYRELVKEQYRPSCKYYGGPAPFYYVTEYVLENHIEDARIGFISGSDYDSVYDFHFNKETDNIDIKLDDRFVEMQKDTSQLAKPEKQSIPKKLKI